MRCRFISSGDNCVTTIILSFFSVCGINDSGNNLASVLMCPLDNPIPFAQRKINHGNLFIQQNFRIFIGTGKIQGCICSERLISKSANLLNCLACLRGIQRTCR